jgi:thioredoxin reductase
MSEKEGKVKDFDLIVSGGGLSGIAAAIAAAREGARVLLIEQYGFLGGMATAGLVNPFMPYAVWKSSWQYDWSKKVNEGIFGEILEGLAKLGGLHENGQTFNEELLKLLLDRMMKKYGIKVLLHSFISGVKRCGSKIESVTVTNKSGIKNTLQDILQILQEMPMSAHLQVVNTKSEETRITYASL